jgi:hypothetical protein
MRTTAAPSAAELDDQQPYEGQEKHDQIDVEKGHGRPFIVPESVAAVYP